MGSVGAFYQSRLSENIRNARGTQQARQQGQVWTARKSPSLETPVEPVQAARPISRDEASLPELTARLENDPAAMAGRMRTRYGEVQPDGLFVETGKEGLSPVDGSRKNALEGQLSQAEDALGRNDLEGAEDALLNGAPKAEEPKLPGLPGQEKQDAEDEKALDGKTAQGAESAQEALEAGECETCESRKYQDGSDDMGVSFQTPTNIKPEQAASAVRGHEMEHVYREQAKAGREGRKVVSQNVTMHTEICPECGKSYVSGGTTRTVTKADTDNAAQQQDLARQNEEEQKTRTPFSAVA
ncbi:hypothetical protein [uncultured Oscillibacter sp.]|nr:hypothetical protein [uncultured Oscillibacter sp.]